ncbi:MAG TPA: HAMP domain-containing sensor histidine kinase, partial [Acidimicrobiales bacterium]|nr:HAMP domain-containing sensor histidine kinase [Acidimicrobiales bacterium]
RLTAQIDRSLMAAAQQLTMAAPGVGTLADEGAGQPPAGQAGTGGPDLGEGAHAPGGPAGPPPGGPAGLLDLVAVQSLSRTGAVDRQVSDIALPVTGQDRTIAQRGGAPWLRTENVDGTPYRIVTAPLPRGGAVQVAQSLGQTQSVLRSLRWLFALLALAITLVAALLGWLVARRITGPLEQLTDAAESVAEGGALDRNVSVASADEVGRLGRAFSTMLAALSTSRRQQRQLVEDAGHELRTPITSLRSNIDLLTRHHDELSPTAMTRVLGDLKGELRELTDLVDEVVELATDRRDDEPASEVRMDELTTRVVMRIRTRSGRTIELDTEPWSVVGQRRSLERAVTNLLDNAVKFSEPGTTIQVDARCGRVIVRDHGPGIAASDLPHVFDRFYRATSARSEPGSGLGLAIVREVAEAHAGTAVATDAAGGGAQVGMRLPGALVTHVTG